MFLVLWLLGVLSMYVGLNKSIEGKLKIGYFGVIAIVAVVYIIFGVIL